MFDRNGKRGLLGTTRRRFALILAIGLAFSLIGLVSQAATGGFEIDASQSTADHALFSGNDSTGAGDDWAQGSSNNGVFIPSTSSPHTAATDCYDSNIDLNSSMGGVSTLICDGNSDSKFTGNNPLVVGGQPEQNVVSPSGKSPDDVWPIKPGNVRPKNDFSHAYVNGFFADSPCDADFISDDLMLRLGGHVGDNEGDHFWGFEFDRNKPDGFANLAANNGTSFNLNYNRSVGDLLISFTVPGTTNEPVALEVLRVSGFVQSGSDAGDAIFTAPSPIAGCPGAKPQGDTKLDTNGSNDVEAPPWNVPVCDPTQEAGGINDNNNSCRIAQTGLTNHLLAPRDFAEANVDLAAFGINDVCFTNVIFSSRSAHVLEGADVQDVGGKDFPLCAAKSGVKFEDLDGDGVKDAGEPGLNGWTIKLFRDANGNGTLEDADDGTTDSTFTAADTKTTATTSVGGVSTAGYYKFENIAGGAYIVCETLQSGWNQSYPNSSTTLPSGETLATCPGSTSGYAFVMSGADRTGNDFGNYRNGGVSGIKFKDADDDGVKDSSEVGMSGWEIHLFGTPNAPGSSAVHLHANTDATGAYSFSVAPGTYTVCETLTSTTAAVSHADWVQSFPTTGADCSSHTVGASASTVTPGAKGHSVTVASGDTTTNVNKDFGNSPLSHITINFFSDGKLSDGTDATNATSITCVDKSGGTGSSSVGDTDNDSTDNDYTSQKVRLRQRSMVCTVNWTDP